MKLLPTEDYQDNGLLTPRSEKGAILKDVDDIVTRCQQLLTDKTLTSLNGKKLAMKVDTLCVHGDNQESCCYSYCFKAIIKQAKKLIRDKRISFQVMAMFTPDNHHIPQNNQLTEQVSLEFVAENAVLLTWPEVIDPNQHQQIIQVEQAIKQHFTCALLKTIVSYNSLILYYQFQKVTQVQLIEQLTELLNSTQPSTLTSTSKVVEIPVYYGEDAGWDLATIAAEKKTHH